MDEVVFNNNDQVSCFSTLEEKKYLTVLAADMYDFDKATCSSDTIRLTKQYKVCRIARRAGQQVRAGFQRRPAHHCRKIADDYVFDIVNCIKPYHIAGGFIDTNEVHQLSITPSIDQEFIFITYEGYPVNPMTGVADKELQATKWKHYLRRAVFCRGHPTESLTSYLKKAAAPGLYSCTRRGFLSRTSRSNPTQSLKPSCLKTSKELCSARMAPKTVC